MRSYEIELDPWDDTKWALGASAIVLQASLSRSHDQSPALLEVKNRLSVVTSLAAK